ncbi:MAG: DEAD/DEAH box helicase, partial [Thermoplasmata archaeon]
WRDRLEKTLNIGIGQIGGGEKDIRDITVSTYDSAYLMAEDLGNKFKFLLVDEVHHLASERFIEIAKMFASPYRMGLTATYERVDMLHEKLEEVMGGKIFELGYEEISDYISNYQIIRIPVDLEQEEEEEYEKNRSIFISYLRKHRITMRGPWDFEKFILSSWNPEGREALIAWRRAREIAFNARVKVDTVRYVLSKHRNEKTLIFSEDTSTAYLISKEFLIPCITYLTPGPERKKYLEMFRNGEITALATSRVLDEGIDVPDASIGIVLSGSGSTRQFRQRLGRLLRPSVGKNSILYEIVAKGTSEYGTSRRRRKGVPDSIDDN